MKTIRDGWHNIAGYNVFVEDGQIVRGTKPSYTACGEEPAYVYRWLKQYKEWSSQSKITIDAFRAGIKRGTIALK